MENSTFVVARRQGADGQPVGERHAVIAAATRKAGPFRAECGAQVHVVVGAWPPEGADEHACPVCYRDTSTPFA